MANSTAVTSTVGAVGFGVQAERTAQDVATSNKEMGDKRMS
jgi:hypothetical protein